MGDTPGQIEVQVAERRPFRPPQLLTARERVNRGHSRLGVQAHQEGAIDPLLMVRSGRRGIRFDPVRDPFD